jgi:hypothetical protein
LRRFFVNTNCDSTIKRVVSDDEQAPSDQMVSSNNNNNNNNNIKRKAQQDDSSTTGRNIKKVRSWINETPAVSDDEEESTNVISSDQGADEADIQIDEIDESNCLPQSSKASGADSRLFNVGKTCQQHRKQLTTTTTTQPWRSITSPPSNIKRSKFPSRK